MDRQTPNEGMLAMGLKSIVVAAGLLSIMTMWPGITVSGAGAAPIEHCRSAPVVTRSGMVPTYGGGVDPCKSLFALSSNLSASVVSHRALQLMSR